MKELNEALQRGIKYCQDSRVGGGESVDSVIFDYIAEALTAMKFEPEEKCNLCGGYHGNLSCDEYADNPHDLDNNNMKESEPKEECSGDTTCKYCGKCDKEYAERDKPIDQIPSVQDLPVDYDPLTGQHFDKLDKPDPILAVWEKWKNEAYKFDSGLVSVPRNSLREMWQAIKQYAEAQSDNSKHAK